MEIRTEITLRTGWCVPPYTMLAGAGRLRLPGPLEVVEEAPVPGPRRGGGVLAPVVVPAHGDKGQ